MSKDVKPGGSSKTPSSAGGTGKKNKVVTFKENESEEEKGDEPPRFSGSDSKSPPNPPKPKEKPKKGGIDLNDLDKGMEKLRRKFSGDTPDAGLSKPDAGTSSSKTVHYRPQPWQVDPSTLFIGKVLGKGAFGTVYRGKYNGQSVAIKMLDWGSNDPDDSWAMGFQYKFFMEVEIMYSLANHPNVCKLLGASLGSSDFTIPSPIHGSNMIPVSNMMCCIVMEYVAGGSLREFWMTHRRTGRRRMPFSIVVQFAIDIARGLAYLHSKNVLHRDLKPDNVLITRDNVLKIADFGLSRVAPDPDKADDTVTLYRGTPNYCAPEILDGKEYTHKADVYSYGISLWEIYTCDVPYPEIYNINHGRINHAIINDGLRPSIPICCPSELRHVMTRCWDGKPDKRPEMREVLQMLERIDTDQCRCLTSDTAAECTACIVDISCRPRYQPR